MSVYDRIAGTQKPRLKVWPLLNDIWAQGEGILTWDQVKVRQELTTADFQELKSWFQALHAKAGNSRQRARSFAHQLLIAIERNDSHGVETIVDGETEITRVANRLTEQQVLTYLGL